MQKKFVFVEKTIDPDLVVDILVTKIFASFNREK